MSYLYSNRYDQAQKDFEQALKLFPASAAATPYRAGVLIPLEQTLFLKNDFTGAAMINQQIRSVNPYTQSVGWLHIERTRVGQDDRQELEQNSKALTPNPWETSLLAFFAGHMSADDLIQKTANPDAKIRTEQSCEANFFIAESLMTIEKTKAVPYFQADDKSCNNIYKFVAHETLVKMGVK